MTHPSRQHFASDNYAGICPEALQAMVSANEGHIPAYGEDRWTQEASDYFRELFQCDCEVFFVFTGTAGNSLAISALCQSYHSVICHPTAHIETDECGGPEFFSHGSKLLLAGGEQGKINPATIEEIVLKRTDIHYPKPKVVSITQATELGTVYSKEEITAICQMARRHQLKVHMDGARFANAVVELGCTPKEITVDAGVDVLVFGGAKNGLAVGEAVIFFNKKDAEEFSYRCKQAGQLSAKMRFIAAQWLGLLKGDAWLRYAGQANAAAALLEKELRPLDGVKILFPRQANSVFVQFDEGISDKLHDKGWKFYTFIGEGGARLMCSWDTKTETVHEFIQDLKSCS